MTYDDTLRRIRIRAGKKHKGCRLCKLDVWDHNCKKYKGDER